ncbi:MAG: response regulator [Candidatus Aminicenantes bacterium]|nr:response regulator [Candidatus Aminicenantes bacterium]NIM81609.1 response regulator [Candidatus Aminicenantes bacterium]NIN20980.1 response regulator [Candidatus Aminicenantes bacterium]NIN44801.1 response regulator [Candidatus Aminicenantes bacterium]NIN87609.1 response regulator [Candidatus Aminicenantes bacterium]
MPDNKILKRIMYVDDDTDLQRIVQLGLEMGGGFTVKVCGSGEQVLREIADFQPDLLILDVVMPDMSGPKTLKTMQNMPDIPSVPVVFFTSKTGPEHLQHYRSLGAIGVIKKPLDFKRLPHQVKEIWEIFNSKVHQ